MNRLSRWVATAMAGCFLAAALAVIGPELAYAQPHTVVMALAESVDEVLNNLRNWIMGILAGMATVMWSMAGVRLCSDGNLS